MCAVSLPAATRRPLRVALLGAGTVGRELARTLATRPELPFTLAGIGVRDLVRAQQAGLNTLAPLTTDLATLAGERTMDVVVELIGGIDPARELVGDALAAGRPVVTANKALLARYGAELEAAAHATRTPLRFSAAVGGGVPVIETIAGALAGNRITRIRGVLNGTTNFILSEMEHPGSSYAAALAAAQAAGFAEADPSADVEGHDAAAKLLLLARLASGHWFPPEAVEHTPHPGITGVSPARIAVAMAAGQRVRLLASYTADTHGLTALSVGLAEVDAASPFGQAAGSTNSIVIEGDLMPELVLAGPGAGARPTASAVLADLIAIARGEGGSLPERFA